MSGFALSLVLSSALLHATWNLLAKRVPTGGPPFIWLISVVTTVLFLPLNIWYVLTYQPSFARVVVLFMVGTAVLHGAYFVMLQHGYSVGDLSVVYPLARGTGPMLSTLAAILFLGERPTPLALLGALLIISGVFLLSGGPHMFAQKENGQALLFGVLTGVLIAGYTLWDKVAVSTVLVAPLLLDYAGAVGRVLILAPFAARSPGHVREVWQNYRWEVVGVAVLSPVAYILVLTALTFAPVSYVAPTREVSTLIGVLLGVFLLQEGQLTRRLSAASLIVCGVVALAFPT